MGITLLNFSPASKTSFLDRPIQAFDTGMRMYFTTNTCLTEIPSKPAVESDFKLEIILLTLSISA